MDFSSVKLRTTETKVNEFDVNSHFETLRKNKKNC